MSIDDGSDIQGIVMDAENERVRRLLDRIPEVATLTEYPWYRLLAAADFPAVEHRFCDRLRDDGI
jgi:hypothetical protein